MSVSYEDKGLEYTINIHIAQVKRIMNTFLLTYLSKDV
jgi:hypothetical protein